MEFIFILLLIVVAIIVIFTMVKKFDVRNKGIQTEGQISKISPRTYTDAYGISHTTYYAQYQFTDENGMVYRGEKSLGSARPSRTEGETVTVYYLPEKPERNDADF